jgi:hypothetical protein
MGKILLEDGVSALLLEDGTSALLTEGNITLALSAGSFSLIGKAVSFSRLFHRYWRIQVNTTYSNNSTRLQEIEMYTAIGGTDVCSGGTATASRASTDAPNAFDNNTGTAWDTLVAGGSLPDWIQYDFGAGNEKLIKGVGLIPNSTSLQCPKDLDVLYSDDGSTWTTAWSVTSASYPGGGGSGATFSKFSNPTYANHSLVMDVGSFTFNGQSASLSRQYTLALSAGSFALNGNAASFTYQVGHTLPLAPGSFAVIGQNASFTHGYRLSLGAGSFALTGESIAFNGNHALTLSSGSFALTGNPTGLARQLRIALSPGGSALNPTYNFLGNDAKLIAGRHSLLTSGLFTLTGSDVLLRRDLRLPLGCGLFIVTPGEASLTFKKGTSMLLGKVAVYPAYNGAPSIKPAYRGEPDIYPALNGAPILDRWVA